jgi:hypothetical protein
MTAERGETGEEAKEDEHAPARGITKAGCELDGAFETNMRSLSRQRLNIAAAAGFLCRSTWEARIPQAILFYNEPVCSSNTDG